MKRNPQKERNKESICSFIQSTVTDDCPWVSVKEIVRYFSKTFGVTNKSLLSKDIRSALIQLETIRFLKRKKDSFCLNYSKIPQTRIEP